jgi:hypothetical protein
MTSTEASSLATTKGGGFTRHLISSGGSYSTYIRGTVRQTLGHFLTSRTMLKVKLDTQKRGYSDKEPLWAILKSLYFKRILVERDVPICPG